MTAAAHRRNRQTRSRRSSRITTAPTGEAANPASTPAPAAGGRPAPGTGTGTATGTGNGSGTGTGTGSGNGSANGSGNGSGCGSTLSAPFTIEACWTADADHDTYLFLPKESASSADNPFIYYSCGGPGCDTAYPFACIAPDIRTTGCEVTTIHQLLDGTYEYYLELDPGTPAGAVTVKLARRG